MTTTKPRIWNGGSIVTPHWWWNGKRWAPIVSSILLPSDIFLPPYLEQPTIDPTKMKLEGCSEVDWT